MSHYPKLRECSVNTPMSPVTPESILCKSFILSFKNNGGSFSTDLGLNSDGVNNCEIPEYQQEWPFSIRLPLLWKIFESNELYQNPLQKPHFLPLKNLTEFFREGAAIGHMATFANIFFFTTKLKFDETSNHIMNVLTSLAELETHGFNVSDVRARLYFFLSNKANIDKLIVSEKECEKDVEKQNFVKSNYVGELEEADVEMNEADAELCRAQVVIDQLQAEIDKAQVTRGKAQVTRGMVQVKRGKVRAKFAAQEEVFRKSLSTLEHVSNQVRQSKIDFLKVLATPL